MSTEKIMEQAQVFASAWSLVGSRFDFGDAIDNANEEEERLGQMIEELVKDRDDYAKAADTQAAAHKVERDELTAKIAALEYRVDELTHSRDELKPDAERYRWMSAQIVSGDFDLLEKAFGTLDPQAEFDGSIDAALNIILK